MRKLVTVETVLEKKDITGADKIEAVRVRDWWVVTKKDEFQVGSDCVYFEIDSFLPIIPPFDFLVNGSTKKRMVVDGVVKEGIRLKTIRLRGQLSQGLVMPIDVMNPYSSQSLTQFDDQTDVSEYLGVSKYEVPLPAEVMGLAKGFFPSFIPKTDEERIQNMSPILSGYFVTEKLDGTSTTFFKDVEGNFGVCSRNLELKEGDQLPWQIARRYDLANKLPVGMAIQCELIGEGIQKNPLKQSGQDIYCFNVFNIEWHKYLDYKDFVGFCSSIRVKTVPVISDNYRLPETVDELLIYCEGKSALNSECEREGIVVRPKIEILYKGSRLSFKVISNRYLLKDEN